MRGHGSQWFSHKMNNRHPLQLKKSKSWEPFGSYQLNSTANPAHLPLNWARLAKQAVLFSWQLQKGSQDFDCFNCHGCRIFILCEIHCYFCPHISCRYIISVLASVCQNGQRPMHLFKQDWQNRQQGLRSDCPDICTVPKVHF